MTNTIKISNKGVTVFNTKSAIVLRYETLPDDEGVIDYITVRIPLDKGKERSVIVNITDSSNNLYPGSIETEYEVVAEYLECAIEYATKVAKQ